MKYEIEAITKQELEEILDKKLAENNRMLLQQIGQSLRSILLNEKIDELVERKIEEKIKNIHLSVS